MLKLTSTAFPAAGEIPLDYTQEGSNMSPALAWEGIPEGTVELALMCEDPDAPQDEPWVHWVLYAIPPILLELPENLPKEAKLISPFSALQGYNSSGHIGYTGPLPPRGHGWHRYFFKLYALRRPLNLPPALTKTDLISAMNNCIIEMTEYVGRYKRDEME